MLIGIMTAHSIFSFLFRPIRQHGLPKMSRDRLFMTASAAIGLCAALSASVRFATSFGRILPWILAAGHAFTLCREIMTAKPCRSVIDGAASSALLVIVEGINGSQNLESSDATPQSLVTILLSILLLAIFLSVPRERSKLPQGRSVDRQNTACLIEVLFFLWPRKVFRLQDLRQRDINLLPLLPVRLRTSTLTENHRRFASRFSTHRLGFVLLKEYSGALILQSSFSILNSLAALGPNLILYRLLQHLGGERESGTREKMFLASLLGLSHLLPVIISSWMKWIGTSMIDVPMRYTLASLTYQKVLSLPTITLSAEEKEAQSMATLLHMNALSARACSAFPILHRVVGLFTQLIFTTVVLIALVRWQSVAIAIAAALSITPLTMEFMNRWTASLFQIWKLMSSRNATLRDALLAIRQIKLSAAEACWKQKIYQIRDKEVRGYSDIAFLRFWMEIIGDISPAVLSGLPVYLYAQQSHELTASVAFTFISLFKDLQSQLWAIPQELPRIRAGWNSAGELDAFLRKEEMKDSQFVSSSVLSLRNATITWHTKGNDTAAFQLRNVQAEFPAGELSIVTGKTGSGKSLLLSALAGEAKILSGDICRPCSSKSEHTEEYHAENWTKPGSFALVSQNPWMDNATIQDNILFGLPMDAQRYSHVLYCCALDKDLLNFKDGDMTVITIKGVSLSGGQRSRIALARALYSRASFLLMDDVLSAVDAEVRKWIVEKALCGSLSRGRTRILVTHHEDQVHSEISYRLLIQDQTGVGEIVPKKTPPSITQSTQASSLADDGFSFDSLRRSPDKKATDTPAQASKPDAAEETFRLAPYIMYFNASGGAVNWLLAIFLLAICEWNTISVSLSLERWVSEGEKPREPSTPYSLSPGQAYMVMSALTTLTMSIRGLFMFRLYRAASKKLFYRMMEHIFGAPLRWLESTSHGDILQRCDRDIRIVDEDLTYSIGAFLALCSQLITVLLSSASLSLYSTPAMIALFWLFLKIGKKLIPATKYLTSVYSKTTSAFAQHRSSLYALDGLSTVRTYGVKNHFSQRANKLLDDMASATWYNSLHSVVTEFQLGLLGAIYVALSCYTIIASNAKGGAAGAALSFAVQLGSTVSALLQHISSMDSSLRTAERVHEYGCLEQEPMDGLNMDTSWPDKGDLVVSHYVAGYGPGLSDALRDVSFIIRPGETVGVVGRTGAGKSTLALAFARLIERRHGSILIDSVDISRVKLEVLRNRILTIPQDPHLFRGSLRATIDPDNVYSDEELVASLQQYRFFSVAASAKKESDAEIPDLSFMVNDGGSNLSQGQRQILCLIKAILSRKKIIILDEATSAVDMETDAVIQTMIQEALHDSTVMVIAHRLATVCQLDKVLVMQDGKVVEFGKPAELYRQKGQFWGLVNHSIDKEDLVRSFAL